ncbi:UDP-glycosyltransferase-20 [Ephemera danica]|nr:UDP-glycosyltransferase-20 [Ephemera danica]
MWRTVRALKSQNVSTMRCVALLCLMVICSTEAARILAVLPCPSRSHHIWNRVLLEALAARGHDVTSLTPFQEADRPNLRYIYLKDQQNAITRMKSTLLERAEFSARQNADAFFQCCFDFCRNVLKSAGTKEVLAMKGQFDLLIMESFGFECMFGFVSHFNLPTVAVSAHGHTPWNCKQMNVPEETAVLPLEPFPYSTPMTLLQRLQNLLLTLYMKIRRHVEYLPKHEAIAREVFGPEMPAFNELEQNFDVFLVNSVPVLDPPRPLPPAVIEVGYLHCKPGNPLPADIQTFLDGGTEGAVYFSLGSNVRSDTLPAATLKALVTVFAELPQRVLWKWESDEEMPRKPSNVKLVKWIAQQDVLAHRNVHLFMTHGGRLSTLEGLYHSVPMLVMPVFYDQYLHGHRVEELGMGMRLNINNVTEPSLRYALTMLLGAPRYRERARAMSSLSRDQPESPLERAVYWTEYVLRHGGASHLRPGSHYLAWYQLYMLDVAAILVLVPLALVSVLLLVVRRLSRARAASVSRQKKRL